MVLTTLQMDLRVVARSSLRQCPFDWARSRKYQSKQLVYPLIRAPRAVQTSSSPPNAAAANTTGVFSTNLAANSSMQIRGQETRRISRAYSTGPRTTAAILVVH